MMNASGSDQPNEAARIEAIVLADAPMADRVGAALAAAGARVTRVTASEALARLAARPPELILVDVEADYRAATSVIRAALDAPTPPGVLVLSPDDAIVGEVVAGMGPLTFVPRRLEAETIGEIVARARAARHRAPAMSRPATPTPARWRLTGLALGCTIVAAIVAFIMPGGWAILAAPGRAVVVAGLAAASFVCLSRAGLASLGALQGAAVALIAVLPTTG